MQSEWPKHPLAYTQHRSGAIGMKAGHTLEHISGRKCRADEFLHDGDAFVTFLDNGQHATVRWRELRPLPTEDR